MIISDQKNNPKIINEWDKYFDNESMSQLYLSSIRQTLAKSGYVG